MHFTQILLMLTRARPDPPTDEAAQAFSMARDKYANAVARDSELEQVCCGAEARGGRWALLLFHGSEKVAFNICPCHEVYDHVV